MGLSYRTLLATTAVLSLAQPLYAADADRVIFAQPSDEVEVFEEVSGKIAGFVEGSYAYGRGKSGGLSADGSRWALRGSVNTQVDRNWNVQLDAGYNNSSVGPVDIQSLVGAAHAYYRVPDSYAIGAFAQAGRLTSNLFNALVPLGADPAAIDLVAGGEAAVFTDPATLYAQLGYGKVSYSGLRGDHFIAKAGARLYATDNLRLDVEGTWNRLSAFGGNADLYSVSAIGNYRLDQVPATVFAGYQYDYGSISVGGAKLGNAHAHTFLTGLKFHFGSGSLKDEERRGPVWTTTALSM